MKLKASRPQQSVKFHCLRIWTIIQLYNYSMSSLLTRVCTWSLSTWTWTWRNCWKREKIVLLLLWWRYIKSPKCVHRINWNKFYRVICINYWTLLLFVTFIAFFIGTWSHKICKAIESIGSFNRIVTNETLSTG